MDASFCDTRDLADTIKLRILGLEMVLGHPGGPRVITRTHGEAEEVSRSRRGVEGELLQAAVLKTREGRQARGAAPGPGQAQGRIRPQTPPSQGGPVAY